MPLNCGANMCRVRNSEHSAYRHFEDRGVSRMGVLAYDSRLEWRTINVSCDKSMIVSVS